MSKKEIETAREAYKKAVVTKRIWRNLKKISDSPLPKQKKGRGGDKNKKHQDLTLQAWIKAQNADQKFQSAAKKLSDDEAMKLMKELEHDHSF